MTTPAPEAEPAWLTEAYQRKEDGREMFAHAVTTVDVEAVSYGDVRQSHTQADHHTIPAGTRVLITVVSRFGDVGIRGRDVDRIEHGYHTRVMPGVLRDDVFVDDGGRPWRKEMLERLGLSDVAAIAAVAGVEMPKPKTSTPRGPLNTTRSQRRRMRQASQRGSR